MGAAATPGLMERFEYKGAKTLGATLGGSVTVVKDRWSSQTPWAVIKATDCRSLGIKAQYEQAKKEASHIWWLHERKVPNIIECRGEWRLDDACRIYLALQLAPDGDLFADVERHAWSWSRTRNVMRQLVGSSGAGPYLFFFP